MKLVLKQLNEDGCEGIIYLMDGNNRPLKATLLNEYVNEDEIIDEYMTSCEQMGIELDSPRLIEFKAEEELVDSDNSIIF